MTTTKKDVLTALIIDALTGKETIRELTADELTQRKSDETQTKAQEAEATARADARTSALAKLSALGLTQAEIEAL
jgi:DNA-binding NarL/FixJ family response regulator